ncbi:hypothetical protein MTO96_011250 [Rhipicephalus appendiculatus]
MFDEEDSELDHDPESKDNDLKRKLVTSPWTPPDTYNFKANAAELNQARAFRPAWLSQYPWLVYSSVLKGALCRQCVVFKPVTGKARQKAFIVTAVTKYKKFHESAKEHEKCEWHKDATERRDDYLRLLNKATDVALQLDTAAKEEVECNKQKLVSITAAVHDLPLRGKQSQSGIFEDLLRFRVDTPRYKHISTISEYSKRADNNQRGPPSERHCQGYDGCSSMAGNISGVEQKKNTLEPCTFAVPHID